MIDILHYRQKLSYIARSLLVSDSTFAALDLLPFLLGVPGVSKVETFGGEVRQYQVRVHPQQLTAHGLDLSAVIAAARASTAASGAGFIDTPSQRIVVRTEKLASNVTEIGNASLAVPGGATLRLSDVADIVEGHEPQFGDAQVMGDRGVIMLVHAQYGANTLEVTRAVEAAIAEIGPSVESMGIQIPPALFRPASFIERALANLQTSLLLGGLLVVAVLFVFLRDFRSAFISFVSIPLSLTTAVAVLDSLGVSINTMTLGGLAIAIGVVVDDAIIDVENILRRLRQRSIDLATGKPVLTRAAVVLSASLEVRSAAVYASVIVALVVLPVLAMTGVEGSLFGPLAIAFILAVMASLLVALTVTPALCLTLFTGEGHQGSPRWLERLVASHRKALVVLSRHPRAVEVSSAILVVAAIAVLPWFGGELLPEFKEGHYVLHMTAAPGTSLEESMRIGRIATAALLTNPRIRQVAQHAGRAENGEDTWGTNLSEFHIDLDTASGPRG